MKQWLVFWLLGLIWGSSFLLIKVAVPELGTLPLVSIRIGTAALLMFFYLQLTHRHLPNRRADILGITLIAIVNIVLPFTLITHAEETIDSSLATVLNSTVPLFSLVIAHFALVDDRLNRYKVLGLVVGYGGILVLTGPNLVHARGNSLAGQAMMLAATLCYAFSYVFIRARLRSVEPIIIAASSLMVAACIIIPFTLLTGTHFPDPGSLHLKTIAAVLTLASLNTVVAYFLMYHLLSHWGARGTLVTYVFPPVGITLGAIFLDEPVNIWLLFGAALILGGIFIVNYKKA